ncbi:MAG: cupredoxin domain-containing protein [Pseudomonadota bacterium]
MIRPVLFALALSVAASTAAAQSPDSVEIDLSNFRFTPATITLHHGQPYVLHFVNKAGGGHDFVSKGFFAAATVEPRDRAALSKGGVSLDGGQSIDIHLTAPAPGRYEAHCSHFLHSSFGMTGAIVVD